MPYESSPLYDASKPNDFSVVATQILQIPCTLWVLFDVSWCSLETIVVKVSSTEETTIHQLICTELIVHYITFRVNSILTDVCFGTIITAQKECIIFDRLHQFPECNQSVITVKSIIINRCILTNALVKLLFNFLCLLIIDELNILCHYFSELNDLRKIIKRTRTGDIIAREDTGTGFHKLTVNCVGDGKLHRVCDCIP